MAVSQVPPPNPTKAGTTEDPQLSRDHGCYLLRLEERLPVAALLPCDFPPWEAVYHYFRRWSLDGTWERVHRTIRERLRASLGRTPQPSAAIVVDSQSAK